MIHWLTRTGNISADNTQQHVPNPKQYPIVVKNTDTKYTATLDLMPTEKATVRMVIPSTIGMMPRRRRRLRPNLSQKFEENRTNTAFMMEMTKFKIRDVRRLKLFYWDYINKRRN